MKNYSYRDARGHLYSGLSPTPPTGMTLVPDRVDAVLEDGQSVRMPMAMLDSAHGGNSTMTDAQRKVARAGLDAANAAMKDKRPIATADKAGLSHLVGDGFTTLNDKAGGSILLADASRAINDALAACPRSTGWMRDKVARAASDAVNAVSDGTFQNAVSSLASMARRYHALSFTAVDQADKAALSKASQAISGYADAMLGRRGQPVASIGDAASAQRELRQRISAGWQQ